MPQLQHKLMQLEQNYNRSKQILYTKELAVIVKKKIVKLDEENSKSISKICQYCRCVMHQFYCKVQTHSFSSRAKLCVKCTYQLLSQPLCSCQISQYMPYLCQMEQKQEGYVNSQNIQRNISSQSINEKELALQFSEMSQVESSVHLFSEYQESQPQSVITNKCLKQFANTLAGQPCMKQYQLPSSPKQTQITNQYPIRYTNNQILERIQRLYTSKSRMQQPINKLKIVVSIFELTYENLTPKHQLQAKLMTFFCERVISRTITKTYSPNDIIAKKQIMLIYNCWIEKAKQYLKDEKNTILRECPNRDYNFFKKLIANDPQLSAVNELNKKSWYFHGLTRNPQNWNRLISRLKNGEYDFSFLPFSNEPAKSSILRIRLPK